VFEIAPIEGLGKMNQMKFAISLDEQLILEADAAASEMGLSRSHLISTALESYLRKRRQDDITARLNEVYAVPDPDEASVLKLMKTKFQTTIKESW
jgi:metal-responsive CopG/Arc/MetJ family transcriptional regulator